MAKKRKINDRETIFNSPEIVNRSDNKTTGKSHSAYTSSPIKIIVIALFVFLFGVFIASRVINAFHLSPKPNSLRDTSQQTVAQNTTDESITPTEPTPTIPLNPTGTEYAQQSSAFINTTNQTSTTGIQKLPFTKTAPFSYAVKENENLAKIGMEFCNDKRAYLHLVELNNLSSPYTLHFNQVIRVECE